MCGLYEREIQQEATGTDGFSAGVFLTKNILHDIVSWCINELALLQLKSSRPQQQTDQWCRISCTPGSANYFECKIYIDGRLFLTAEVANLK